MTDRKLKSASSGGVEIVSNSAWNIGAFLIGVAANILTLPFVLIRLGPTQFGVAGLIIAIVAPFMLVGVALGLATARNVSSQIIQSGKATSGMVFGSAFSLAMIFGIAGVIVIVKLGPILAVKYFHMNFKLHSELSRSFQVSAFGWAATLGSAILQANYVARQNYRRIAHVNACGAVLTASLTYFFVSSTPSATAYLYAINIGLGGICLFWLLVSILEYRACLASPKWDRASILELTNFGGWQLAAQVFGVAANQTDRYLLGSFVHPDAVAFYNVAQRLEEVAYIGIVKAGEVLFPIFSAESVNDTARRADLFVRSSWLLNLLAACTLGPLLTIPEDVLRTWTDVHTAKQAHHILLILTIGGLMGSAANVLIFYISGMGKSQYNFGLAVLTAVVSCSVSSVLMPRYGLAAAGIGAMMAMLLQLGAVIMISLRLFKNAPFMLHLLFLSLSPIFIGMVIGLMLRFVNQFHPQGWLELIVLYVFISCTIASGIFVVAALTSQGRSLLLYLAKLTKRVLASK